MTVEKVLKESWALASKHWQFLALVALIGFGINIVLGMILAGSVIGGLSGLGAATTGSDNLSLTTLLSGVGLASLGIGAVVSLLVMPWLTGATAHAGKLTVEGQTANAWAPYQAALGQYVPFLLLTIVLGIALGVGFLLLVVPGIILAVLLAMSPMAIAARNLSVGDALKQSWEIGLKNFWTILLVGIIVAAVSMVLSLILGWVPLVGAYISSVVTVFGAVAIAVMYNMALGGATK